VYGTASGFGRREPELAPIGFTGTDQAVSAPSPVRLFACSPVRPFARSLSLHAPTAATNPNL
jgi:hypothetical protein